MDLHLRSGFDESFLGRVADKSSWECLSDRIPRKEVPTVSHVSSGGGVPCLRFERRDSEGLQKIKGADELNRSFSLMERRLDHRFKLGQTERLIQKIVDPFRLNIAGRF